VAAPTAEEIREARLREIGRQLNEEAAKREAAAVAARQSQPSLPFALNTARRGRLYGRSDAYSQAVSQKIHQNMTIDMVRDTVKQPHTDPLVAMTIRSDGSVESVTFVRSSGVAAIDDAVRRIIHSQERYQAFPPNLARDFDVVEIRLNWHFDDSAIRLY
jgi:hypothetical protein